MSKAAPELEDMDGAETAHLGRIVDPLVFGVFGSEENLLRRGDNLLPIGIVAVFCEGVHCAVEFCRGNQEFVVPFIGACGFGRGHIVGSLYR